MPMDQKSTLFFLVNKFEECFNELAEEERNMEMSESYSPSSGTVDKIIAFARSYDVISTNSMDVIDLYLN